MMGIDSRADPRGMNAPGGVPAVAMVLPAAGIGWPKTILPTGVGAVVFRSQLARNTVAQTIIATVNHRKCGPNALNRNMAPD